ncbi:hypothetical protein BCR34DRAFT_582653 [Clohesyomyces aquaticus]|uniref:Uncharacterized protein n=1 Tax=Clohesyomyces aquaticus TaxID=1231657 RepID=A0A1Y2A9J1_9PLEO|nr:hypothetical protein BCR34DRAFT_582653 [Clohesyomyces aquaticus]
MRIEMFGSNRNHGMVRPATLLLVNPPFASCKVDPPFASCKVDPPFASCKVDPPFASCKVDPEPRLEPKRYNLIPRTKQFHFNTKPHTSWPYLRGYPDPIDKSKYLGDSETVGNRRKGSLLDETIYYWTKEASEETIVKAQQEAPIATSYTLKIASYY